jgi:hypothetical protein
MTLPSSLLLVLGAAFLLILSSVPVLAGLALTANSQGRLNDDPDHDLVAAVATKRGKEKAVVEALHITNSEVFPEFGVVFVKAKAREILEWSDIDDVDFVDVLDDTQASVVYHLLAQLHRIEFLDDIGVFRPGVLNLSIGPPRSLIGQDSSGERTVQRAISDLIHRHGIPVVISVGNDGPEPGLTNGWATPGAFLASATNAAGTELWIRSSRFTVPMPANLTMFAAQGIDTIGPRANCRPKSQAERDADERAHLSDVVGPANVACFEIASGTSFAAGFLTRCVCFAHQSMGILALKVSSLTPIDVNLNVPAFVRVYIDSGFDRAHAAFANRLADSGRVYGPLKVKISASEKQNAYAMLVSSGVDIVLRYSPEAVKQLLARASSPVGGLSREQVGEGFVSLASMKTMLSQLRYSDLVDLFGRDDPRHAGWTNRLMQSRNPQVFTLEEVNDIEEYCNKYDLILGMPLFGSP